MRKNNKTFKKILLGINAAAFFIVAFLIGGRLAGAQIQYFDEPTSPTTVAIDTKTQAQLEALRNRPATAQYEEFKDQIDASVVPENPGPNQQVKINLEVYSYDINSAEITWKVNGKVIDKGLGHKTFVFTTGKAGATTKVEATIDPRDRPSSVQTFSFTPGEVDLLWQADVYSHPFYKGKRLYTPESNVVLVAMPRNGTGNIRPSETVFNWKINGSNDAENSGFGRNTYVYEGPIILRDLEAEVETYSPTPGAGDEKSVATAAITVSPYAAGLRLYENSPTLGILFNKALRGNITIDKPEMGIAAYPYFQTIATKNSDTNYTWIVDDNPVAVDPRQNTITLRRSEGDTGQSFVAVQSETPMKILQTAETGVNLSFDRRTSASTQSFGQ